jgi:hypothetical protein
MKKHARCRLLTNYMSIWLYSVGRPPEPVNQIYLGWLNTGKVPSEKVIRRAIKLSEKERASKDER